MDNTKSLLDKALGTKDQLTRIEKKLEFVESKLAELVAAVDESEKLFAKIKEQV